MRGKKPIMATSGRNMERHFILGVPSATHSFQVTRIQAVIIDSSQCIKLNMFQKSQIRDANLVKMLLSIAWTVLHPSIIYTTFHQGHGEAVGNNNWLRARLPIYHMVIIERNSHSHLYSHSLAQFRVASWPELWDKTDAPEETHTGPSRMCKLHTEWPQLASKFKPRTFLLWDNCTNKSTKNFYTCLCDAEPKFQTFRFSSELTLNKVSIL